MAVPKEVVLITGCSHGGIGHALALAFAKENCVVIATARSLASLRDLQNIPNVESLPLDVTSEESRHKAVAAVMERHRRIDILVNNAGIHCVGPVAEMPLSHLENAFKTNVYVFSETKIRSTGSFQKPLPMQNVGRLPPTTDFVVKSTFGNMILHRGAAVADRELARLVQSPD